VRVRPLIFTAALVALDATRAGAQPAPDHFFETKIRPVLTTEFGRTPVSESGDGRDHNPYGFSMFMAGGDVKGGMTYGATDEFGFKAVENRVSIHDLHATILHQLGIDHEKLTYRYAGRDFRLTDVFGDVVTDILA
jgi:uncharacterized protein (DUF1501 family)